MSEPITTKPATDAVAVTGTRSHALVGLRRDDAAVAVLSTGLAGRPDSVARSGTSAENRRPCDAPDIDWTIVSAAGRGTLHRRGAPQRA